LRFSAFSRYSGQIGSAWAKNTDPRIQFKYCGHDLSATLDLSRKIQTAFDMTELPLWIPHLSPRTGQHRVREPYGHTAGHTISSFRTRLVHAESRCAGMTKLGGQRLSAQIIDKDDARPLDRRSPHLHCDCACAQTSFNKLCASFSGYSPHKSPTVGNWGNWNGKETS
jgi:hypothetical protein